MSDTMLLGVLRMPIECWMPTKIDDLQRYKRYLEAANRIEEDQKYIEKLEEVVMFLGAGLMRSNQAISEFTGQDSKWCMEFESLMNQIYKKKLS